ncbi:MAG: queuosine precursor transporter [Bacteroidaceae bacterium]|nr:queuosine precursor transporter [Bacteroidaceae bacterium]MBO7247434.1 queuosine precursor transporter [Bacteroidaceae bacterium]
MNKVSENPFKNRTGEMSPYVIVTVLFIMCYVVSNLMAVKVIGFFGLFYFDAGTLTFPLAYMLGDVITEVWGYRCAKKTIILAFLCNLFVVICTQIGVWLPSVDYLDASSAAYNTIFSYVPRIVIASLTGFLLGELSNAWLMDRIKNRTKCRYLWVRTIGSSIVGYLFDTVPFVLIAFAGTLTVRDLLLMIASQYIMKLVIECIFGTPMAYATIRLLLFHQNSQKKQE